MAKRLETTSLYMSCAAHVRTAEESEGHRRVEPAATGAEALAIMAVNVPVVIVAVVLGCACGLIAHAYT